MNKILLGMVLLFSFSAKAVTTTKVTKAVSAKASVTLTKDNTLVMDDYFDSDTVANLVQKAKQLDSKIKSGEPLYLVLNSGGGSIDAGLELIENLKNLNRPVHTITLWSASMGFQTVQGLNGLRLVTADGTLMSHKARGGFFGEFPGQLDSRYSYYLRKITRMDQRAVSRTKGKHTLSSYRNLIENEYWCDGQDCVAQGFADMVVSPSCGDSLKGTHEKLWGRFMYMNHVIEIMDTFADCPLITGALSYQVYIDGEPLFNQFKEKAAKNDKVDKNDFYYGRHVNETALSDLGAETAMNIKKLLTPKLDAHENRTVTREVRKY